MFTGIINHLGKVSEKTNSSLTITADRSFLSKIKKGISVSVNGICLTVINVGRQHLRVDVMPETENKTNIKYWELADLVNLELPATPSTFLSGHIVLGHVDGIGQLKEITQKGNSQILKFLVPSSLFKYIKKKGSIAVNGISLTVAQVGQNYFTVAVTPYTFSNTMLGSIKVGDFVNIEVDILAKYVK